MTKHRTQRGDAHTDAELRLEQALAATRRRFDGRGEHALLTEQRILEHAWPAPRRRRPLFYLPLVALFAGSVAFAEELGALVQGARARFFSVQESSEVVPPARPASAPERVRSTARSAPAPARATATPESPGSLPSGASVREPTRVTAPARAPVASAPPPVPAAQTTPGALSEEPSVAAPEVDEFALYRAAHQAHFVDHDYAAALTHWDRYLSAARHGSMAPEARYNRALALYHLGRRDEASAALRQFADGAYGRYRREEARRLLESFH